MNIRMAAWLNFASSSCANIRREIENRIFSDMQWAAPKDLAEIRFSGSRSDAGEGSGRGKTSVAALNSSRLSPFPPIEASTSANDNATTITVVGPRHDIKQARVHILPHQFFLVDQQQHEDQDERQHNTVEHLRPQDDLD